MDPKDPPEAKPTAQRRRGFLQAAGAASVAAAVGVEGSERAVAEDGTFETNPYSMGVASGDPLPNAVVLWTRLAPSPLEPLGGMPDEPVDVQWTIATDEDLSNVVQTASTVAKTKHAHTVHVDVRGLEPNTEYYYQFSARGVNSPVGRTKTAPAPGTTPEEFSFAFASCNKWDNGYYNAYDQIAGEKHDLVVHLGDYLYEYPVDPNGGPRETKTPNSFRTETTTLNRYRQQYGLYKSDPDFREAHASAPWIITRDDHEIDNNWADEVPQDPDKQSREEFLQRRAEALKAYYEHMPFRMEQKPDGIDQKLYRSFEFGDLLDVAVLDTRIFRDDQACGDVFDGVGCEERFAEDRTILGAEQREWLIQTLEESDATWTVIANQLPMAPMDFKEGDEEGFRTEQWDGYVPDQRAVFDTMRTSVENPVVITGDFHAHWASELPADPTDDSTEPVGVEFVGTSISSGGNGSDMTDLGRYVIEENENVKYHSDRRGYVRCTVTPDEWVAEHRNVAFVTEPNAPARTDARFLVESGENELQTPPATLSTSSMAIKNGSTSTMDLTASWLDTGLSGGRCTVTLTDPAVARIAAATVHESFGLKEVQVSDDGASATLRFADIDERVQSVVGGVDVLLGSLEVRGENTGTTDVGIEIHALDDEAGRSLDRRAASALIAVGPPSVAGSAPSDPNRDTLYEDVNGNGRIDYDDIVTLFEEFEDDSVQLNASAYDFNQNGRLDYDDIVTLYEEVN